MPSKTKPIVIATDDRKQILFVVAKAGMESDYLELQYIDKYAPTVEYIVRILRKAFGWFESNREKIDAQNTRCLHSVYGMCTHPKVEKPEVEREGKMVRELKCVEAIRIKCPHYQQKSKETFLVNQITIEKAGGIRGM